MFGKGKVETEGLALELAQLYSITGTTNCSSKHARPLPSLKLEACGEDHSPASSPSSLDFVFIFGPVHHCGLLKLYSLTLLLLVLHYLKITTKSVKLLILLI